VYLVGDDDVIGPTPALTPSPSPASTTDTNGAQYEELGCAADLTTGVRVRDCTREEGEMLSGRITARVHRHETRGLPVVEMLFLLVYAELPSSYNHKLLCGMREQVALMHPSPPNHRQTIA